MKHYLSTLAKPGVRAAKALVVGAALMAVIPFAGAAQAEIKIRISSPIPPGEILAQSMGVFKSTLEASAPGEFDVSLHPGGTLFKQGTEIQAMQRGNLEMNTLATFEVSQFVDDLSVYNAGYLFNDYSHLKRVWGGEIGDQYKARVLADMGVRIIGDCYLGTRQMNINQVRNVTGPSDLEGLKVRMPGSPDFLLLGKGLGIDPTPMAFSEVYLAMKSGAVDGQDNPLTITRAAKLDEVTKEVVMTNHMVQMIFLAIAEPVYAGLTGAQQEKISAAANAACAWNDSMRRADESRQEKSFADAGIVISRPDLDAFRANMTTVYEESGRLAEWDASIIQQINDVR